MLQQRTALRFSACSSNSLAELHAFILKPMIILRLTASQTHAEEAMTIVNALMLQQGPKAGTAML